MSAIWQSLMVSLIIHSHGMFIWQTTMHTAATEHEIVGDNPGLETQWFIVNLYELLSITSKWRYLKNVASYKLAL